MNTKNTKELYEFYKSRRNWLKQKIVNIQLMDFVDSYVKKNIITFLIRELNAVEMKIKDLIW